MAKNNQTHRGMLRVETKKKKLQDANNLLHENKLLTDEMHDSIIDYLK